ncbi:hypothetical protein PCCS19_23600 [Paenibacillus sp. CCS19]|uniref:DUF4003 family protein n=1 Tax=Paenibacillus sp. CCS19 TaxID=3158387 RepID=UPI002569CB6F|nr:DUF4003 family protein [Paenibacillus cellulosilyticus]GMK39306.1 hypothetical protein PCCS19_23600 [Paenibacillus cellulosilyticus]
MKENRERLSLFVENAGAMKKGFAWHHGMVNRLAALLYAVEDKQVDIAAIKDNMDRIKKNTGMFSSFRGNVSFAAQLALSDEPDTRLLHALDVFDLLKNVKFRSSPYLPVAAYQIAAHSTKDQFADVVARAKAFYTAMKSNHPYLTGQDDYIYAAMLALSDIEVEAGTARMEQFYTELKSELRRGNALQALTQVLVLGAGDEEPAARVLRLKDAFRSRGIKMDRSDTLSSIGVLALLPSEDGELVENLVQTFEWLRTQKGFGRWSVTEPELLLYCTALVAYQHVQELSSRVSFTTLSTSLTNILIAQEAAMTAAATASVVAASSSSSSD